MTWPVIRAGAQGAAASRHVLALLLLALAWPAARAAPAQGTIAISFSDGPARLVRDKAVYRAGRGVVLRENDMLEAGAGVLQLGSGAASIALGPAARLYVRNGAELVLLDGWLKLQAAPDRPLTVGAPNLRLASTGNTIIVRASREATELFAESGDTQVQELNPGKAARPTRLAHEQFAVRAGALPLRTAARPPAAFLAALPPSFRDQLVPLSVAGAAAPTFERAASFAELAPWLATQPLLRRQVQARFDPPPPTMKARP